MQVSPNRINGFSGMDIDQMVSDMMKAEQFKLDKFGKKKTLLEWKVNKYRDINTKILEFDRNVLDGLKLSGTFSSKISTSSNQNAVWAEATTKAVDGTYTLKVNTLAEAANLVSNKLNASNASGTPYNGQTDLKTMQLNTSDTTLNISGEKGSVTINVSETDTLQSIVNKVNGYSSTTGVRMSYDEGLDTIFVNSTTTGDDAKVSLSSESNLLDVLGFNSNVKTGETFTSAPSGSSTATFALDELVDSTLTSEETLTITYGTEQVDIKVDAKTTIEDVLNEINSSAIGESGVAASLDANGDIAFFNPDNSVSVQFSGDSNVLNKLNLTTTSTPQTVTYNEVTDMGVNAEVEFNGVVGSYDSNTFSISGINLNIKEVTTSPVTISVNNDVDTVYNNIKDFVDQYNTLLEELNKVVSEPRNRSYEPLTKEEKAELSEEEIEKWEEQAQSGLLRNDNMLSSGLDKMRLALANMFTDADPDAISQLAEIGIATGDYFEEGNEYGKLHIDEATLKQAIADNPDQVMQLFTSNNSDGEIDSADGIAHRLDDIVDEMMSDIRQVAGTKETNVLENFIIGEDIQDWENKIKDFEDRMQRIEERYYSQFTAMETYIAQMDSQISYLLGQMNGQ
ncbi:flagellar filament capping protein FliD [Longirhabdus pacifica]|uniref:flagellar filament capping protein FliD n=1 Tax=Longirhabdus pacifica TaxID=2305227 RepID=UPI001008ED37|nr:flagellar filament capping protein FliD [Longirhabdus pacifica]